MEVLKVIILGIIQGITEWLPVSSTGHMLLFDELMPLHQSAEFVSVFMVVVQLGSVLAVVVLFFRKLWPFGKEKSETRRTLTLWGKVLIASIPAGAAGLLFDDVIDSRLSVWPVIAAALALYGIAYIILEKCVRIRTRINSVDELTVRDSLIGASCNGRGKPAAPCQKRLWLHCWRVGSAVSWSPGCLPCLSCRDQRPDELCALS